MKKFSITMILSVAAILTAAAQLRLNFYSAYVFNDGFDVARDANNYFNGTVKGGYQWGAGIQYVFSSMSSAEILYIKQSTHSPTTFKFGTNNEMSEELDVNLNYIMLSGAG